MMYVGTFERNSIGKGTEVINKHGVTEGLDVGMETKEKVGLFDGRSLEVCSREIQEVYIIEVLS